MLRKMSNSKCLNFTQYYYKVEILQEFLKPLKIYLLTKLLKLYLQSETRVTT